MWRFSSRSDGGGVRPPPDRGAKEPILTTTFSACNAVATARAARIGPHEGTRKWNQPLQVRPWRPAQRLGGAGLARGTAPESCDMPAGTILRRQATGGGCGVDQVAHGHVDNLIERL